MMGIYQILKCTYKEQEGGRCTWTINFVGTVNITDAKKLINIFAKTENQESLTRTLHHSRDAAVFRLKHICNNRNNKE